MLTSHAYQAPHDHFSQGGLYQQEGTDASKSQVEGATTKIMNPSPTCGDPFGESVHSGSSISEGVAQAGGSPSHHFAADDEFETMGINIPSSALEEQQQQVQQGGGYNNYHQHQHQMMHQQQQHQQWQHHHHQMQQQQQWHHQGQYMNPNGYGHAYEQYGYGDYGQMYAQGGGSGHPHSAPQGMNSSNGSAVGMGGPSPVGSHNTPSPQGAHSDDGLLGVSTGEDHIRNNNILKRPSPGAAVPSVTGNGGSIAPGANSMHPGVLHHGHQAVVHHLGHLHPHHQGTMASPYHLHGHPQHQIPPPGMPVAKKPKVSKRKKKRDPNEPNKPVSAYALFFRDSQASIKQANPNAAFGDVSKIVASLWDALDPDSKAAYKKRTENAKKEYLKKLAAYRASLVSKGGDSGIGYGYYGYGDVMQNNGIHPSHKYMGASGVTNVTAGGVGQSSSSYMGQPIPPRPPMQHGQPGAMGSSHMHHGHTTSGAYMMQGQMQNGGMMGGQSPHSGHSHGGGGIPHSSMSQHSPMDNNSHLHNQAGGSSSIGGGPIHSPAGGSTSSGSSSGQTPLNTPTSASISSSSPNGCAVSHVNKSSQQGTPSAGAGSSHGKQCGRPGCTNLVQRTPDGWAEEFCSNECVVGQCKEVYTTWSSGSNTAGNNGNGGPPPNPYSSPTAPPVK